MSSDTPRTDKETMWRPALDSGGPVYVVDASFCKALEREIAAITKDRDDTEQIRRRQMEKHYELVVRFRELKAALGELVALKDMKERLIALHDSGEGTDYDDYYRLRPLAWAKARAALSQEQEQEPHYVDQYGAPR